MSLVRKQTGLPQEQIESFGILDQEDRIVYGIDHNLSSNLNEIRLKRLKIEKKTQLL